MKRPLIIWLLIFFHFIITINAIPAGIMMMLRPDGSLLGMGPGWLSRSPFKNYFTPGVILCVVVGGISLVAMTGLISGYYWKLPERFNIYKNQTWPWTFSLYAGITVIAWIAIQLMMTSYFWIQPVIIMIGLMIIILTMIPSVIDFYSKPEKKDL